MLKVVFGAYVIGWIIFSLSQPSRSEAMTLALCGVCLGLFIALVWFGGDTPD